jgi:hypothetical protein
MPNKRGGSNSVSYRPVILADAERDGSRSGRPPNGTRADWRPGIPASGDNLAYRVVLIRVGLLYDATGAHAGLRSPIIVEDLSENIVFGPQPEGSLESCAVVD